MTAVRARDKAGITVQWRLTHGLNEGHLGIALDAQFPLARALYRFLRSLAKRLPVPPQNNIHPHDARPRRPTGCTTSTYCLAQD
jgi:hypothetical protein